MIVAVPDGSGRTIDVRTDDPEYAARRAAEWAAENPFVERGAQLGKEDISAFGDIGRGTIDYDSCILNKGEIADTGTHNELLKNSMIYQNLYSKQLSA